MSAANAGVVIPMATAAEITNFFIDLSPMPPNSPVQLRTADHDQLGCVLARVPQWQHSSAIAADFAFLAGVLAKLIAVDCGIAVPLDPPGDFPPHAQPLGAVGDDCAGTDGHPFVP